MRSSSRATSRRRRVRQKPEGPPDPQTLRRRALDLLARREHGRAELRRKLEARGFEAADVAAVVETLEAEGLLSEARYAESYVRSRTARGVGPVRLAMELSTQGVDDAEIRGALGQVEVNWEELARAARIKRFGPAVPNDPKERARQSRFLQRRGFSAEQIRAAVNG